MPTTTSTLKGVGMLAIAGLVGMLAITRAFAFDAPAYCTPPSAEGYYVYTDMSSYAPGQPVNLCVADNTRNPLFFEGTHPWEVTDQNGNVVYTPPAGTLAANPQGTDYFTDIWNGQTNGGTPAPPGIYQTVFPGLPGSPSAPFTIMSASTGEASPSLESLIGALKNLQTTYPDYQYQIGGLITELSNISGGAGSSNGNQTGSTTPSVDQNGGTFVAGGAIDLVGRNFVPNQSVIVTEGGKQVASAFADGGGNFSTGSFSLPTTPGTYTYTFTESGGYSTNATVTVQ